MEFIGSFTDEECLRIARVLERTSGPQHMVSLPRWTVFAEPTRTFYLATDNRSGHTHRAGSIDELVDALQDSLGW